MTITVYIDSCAWNYLHENNINLIQEFPPNQFTIRVTREVEIELNAIPDKSIDNIDKRPLKAYIKQGLEILPVRTSHVFGFASVESDGTLSPVQTFGGFDVGAFQTEAERDFYKLPEVKQQLLHAKKTKSGLGKNEADASLAVKSLSSIVLTNERLNKNGPLKVAAEMGWQIIHLKAQIEPSGKRIGEYLKSLF